MKTRNLSPWSLQPRQAHRQLSMLFGACAVLSWPKCPAQAPAGSTSYILGAAETFQALHEANQVTYYCVPSGVENGQVEDVVKLYLRDHPETRQKSAPTLVMLALKEKFPCQEGGPDGKKATPRPGLPPGFGISPSRPQ